MRVRIIGVSILAAILTGAALSVTAPAPVGAGRDGAAAHFVAAAHGEAPPVRGRPAPGAKKPPEKVPDVVRAPHEAVAVIHKDAAALYALDRKGLEAAEKSGGKFRYEPALPYTRYFWFPAEWQDEYDDFLIGIKGHFNHLNSQPEFVTPHLIAANVFRVDTRALGWGEHQLLALEKFAGLDVYFHAKKTFAQDQEFDQHWPGGTEGGEYFPRDVYPRKGKKGQSVFAPAPLLPQELIDDLRRWTCSEVPVLNAEHFFYNTVRQQGLGNKELGVGYYEWFGRNGLKKLADYFEVLGLDEKLSEKLFKVWRAVIISRTSGVSQNGRRVGSYNAVTGDVWFTEDVFDESALAKGLVRDRLRDGELKFNAQEWYGRLPCGAPVVFLNDANGNAQAKAPPEVGGDKSDLNHGNDPAIHSYISCLRCHGAQDMLMGFKDYIRHTFRPGVGFQLTDPDYNVQLELRRQYLSDVYGRLAKSQKEYSDTFAAMTQSAKHPRGLSCAAFAKIYCGIWNRLIERDQKTGEPPVTLAVAARELGTDPDVLVKALKLRLEFRGQGDLILQTFLDPKPGAMSREEWESRYQFCYALVHAGQAVPEKFDKEKK